MYIPVDAGCASVDREGGREGCEIFAAGLVGWGLEIGGGLGRGEILYVLLILYLPMCM